MHQEFTRVTGNDRDLIDRFYRLDGRNYGAYKSVTGDYDYGPFTLHIDRVQSDPFASPSALRATSTPQALGIPEDLLDFNAKRIAVADFLAREFAQMIKDVPELRIAKCGQEILERSYVQVSKTLVEVRFQCQFPARGRTILGREMARLADVEIPYAVMDSLDFRDDDNAENTALGKNNPRLTALRTHVETYLDYLALQEVLTGNEWVAFVADQSLLARRSGVSDLPLTNAVPFVSPDSLRASVSLPYAGTVQGMAIPAGITLIAGGGYHGKSTLLNALQRAVYAHILGDGRELVATRSQAMKIRAADGRAVTSVDISAFIANLPAGTDTARFSTENASGSTSQAAAIMEALEGGADTLLIDEDTSATNLLIRDARMRSLIKSEPITPFVDRIRALSAQGVSTILVMGGSGDYLDVADLVLLMEDYRCLDATQQAKEVAGLMTRERFDEQEFPAFLQRHPHPLPAPKGKSKTKSRGTEQITLDRHDIDVSDVEQIVDPGQAEAIAWALRGLLDPARPSGFKQGLSLRETVDALDEALNRHGLSALGGPERPAFWVRPRKIDVVAALNRLRALQVAAGNSLVFVK
ncbi:hypothetical protein HMPREF0044_0081 [Gleimia coleocanis DSM 15436]|uniref:Isopentenyl-diphosphate delta-isomerase n=1 Tax=Gleimia coleocanis DSM 15436 TaxID=525245 RepID=C0VY41_9ACTO|nr:ABC-ATPase domain-containing protein [Gleimia coleocanis]EEH64344.1 hypothetical protein HMPREF0044_0081 [Gleimia coleocanis DSM 15436]